jgi:hypothetical protein
VIGCVFPLFGTFYQQKSGNPASESTKLFFCCQFAPLEANLIKIRKSFLFSPKLKSSAAPHPPPLFGSWEIWQNSSMPGANPTIVCYNATTSLVRLENKNVFLLLS